MHSHAGPCAEHDAWEIRPPTPILAVTQCHLSTHFSFLLYIHTEIYATWLISLLHCQQFTCSWTFWVGSKAPTIVFEGMNGTPYCLTKLSSEKTNQYRHIGIKLRHSKYYVIDISGVHGQRFGGVQITLTLLFWCKFQFSVLNLS